MAKKEESVTQKILDVRRTTQNSRRRIMAAGGAVPERQKAESSTLGGLVIGGLELLDAPRNAALSGVYQAGINSNPAKAEQHRPILQAAKDGLFRKQVITGAKVLKESGVKSPKAQMVGGLLFDTVSDPLMYLTGGAGSFAKGFVRGTGATLTKEAAEVVSKRAGTKIYEAARQKVLKDYKAANMAHLTAKLGGKDAAYNTIAKEAFGSHFDDAVRAMPNAKSYQIYEAAKKRYGDSQVSAYQRGMNLKAGKGFTVAGKTVKFRGKEMTGAALQDAGAALNKKIASKFPGAAGVAGDLSNFTKSQFSTKAAGLDGQVADILKQIDNQAQGRQASLAGATSRTMNNIAAVSKGVTYKGEPISNIIEAAIVGNKIGLTKADLDTIITTTPAQKYAARQLAKNQSKAGSGFIKDPDNMTLGELINLYSRQFRGIAIDESRHELLKGAAVRGSSTDVAGKIAAGTPEVGYFSRVRAVEDRIVPKGGARGRMNVNNAFAQARRLTYDGKTSAEINAMIRPSMQDAGAKIGDDYKFLEEDAALSLATRKASSDRMVAYKEYVDEILGTFGEPVVHVGDGTFAGYRAQGKEIVIPKEYYNLFAIGENVKEISEGLTKITGAAKKKAQSTARSMDMLQRISEAEAVSMMAQMPRGTKMYAMDSAVVAHVNKQMFKQMDDGILAFNNMWNKFYKVWKPAVTGLRPGYHWRNLASSGFNNYLALGAEMLAPDVQKMAGAVAAVGRTHNQLMDELLGGMKNVSIKIGNQTYTAEQIHRMMIENNALSTFMLTDANDMAKAALDDVRRRQGTLPKVNPLNIIPKAYGGATRIGKAVGNTTEEYVRTVNFVGHLKRGFSPEDAAEMVNKYHFDYQDLTMFEQGIKQYAMPFYTWLRKNLPLQIESFLNDPRPYMTLHKATLNGAEAQEIDYSLVPDYIRENFGIPVGRNKDGRVAILDPGLPVGDLSTGKNDLITSINPIAKLIYESQSGQSLLTGAPTRSYIGEEAVGIVNYFKDKGMPLPKWAEDGLLSGPGIRSAAILAYIRNNSGVFRDTFDFNPILDKPKDTQVLQQGRNYSNFQNKPVAIAEQFFDPNFFKYYSPEAGELSAEYKYNRELQNEMQKMKDMGKDVKTINELKKGW